jgi:capsular polysaccharide biosynthesis protein
VPLENLNDLHDCKNPSVYRREVAAVAGAINPRPLIPGTEVFVPRWLAEWHQGSQRWEPCDVACYSILDAVVSGAGQVWVGGRLITSPEIMPPYVANSQEIATGGNDQLRRESTLPIRTIGRPCLVTVGHGIQVYGHFLIEMLFRILVARKAFQNSGLRYGLLLDQSVPRWLLAILEQELEISTDDIELFDSTKEQVRLRHAILPGRVFIGERVHPIANLMIDELLRKLDVPRSSKRRIFVTRRCFHNFAAPYRLCVNEAALVDIAAVHGFIPVATEDMTWREQIGLFRSAEIIVGQAGSALHTALFSAAGSRLASVGFMNLVQAQIGALRGQETAYLADGIKLAGEFRVEETAFTRFLEAVCRESE